MTKCELHRRVLSGWVVIGVVTSASFGLVRSATAQPVFSRTGDGSFRNLSIGNGIFSDPEQVPGLLAEPSTACAGNGGPGMSNPATGALCIFSQSSGQQTYLAQFGLTVPPNTQTTLAGKDQVALYDETRLGAFSAGGWAENPLIQANKDAGTAIISEMDLNNLSGCDNPGVASQTTGGSAPFTALRSDGSACPAKIGLLLTGVAGNTSSAGLQFQYVSDGTHAMWQDGIKMLGGYMVAENEWNSDTGAPTAFKIKGSHSYDGLGLESGRFAESAISLSATSQTNGRILWHCPDSGCTNGSGYPTSVALYPSSDGALHEVGAALAADSGLRVAGSLTSSGTTTLATGVSPGTSGLIVGSPPTPPTIMSGVYAPSGWSNYVTEWYVGSNQIAYLSPAGQFVLPAQLGGLYVAGQGEIAGNVKADSNLTVSGTLTTATISGGSQGTIVLTSPPQLPKFTTAALPANCAVGQMVYVSDGRKQGEAAGSGTGVTAVCTLLTSKSSPAWVPLLIASSAVAN